MTLSLCSPVGTRARLLALSLAVLSPAALAQPAWYHRTNRAGFQYNVPDFYQHQWVCADQPNWERGGGWCRQHAFLDTMWSWSNYGRPTLVNVGMRQANTWQPIYGFTIYSMTTPAGNPRSFTDWIRTQGYLAGVGPGRGLLLAQFDVDQATGNVSYVSAAGVVTPMPAYSAFGLYAALLLDEQAVILRFAADTDRELPPPAGEGITFDTRLWWRGRNVDGGDYHNVTGAGVDRINRYIYFADPDSNKGNTNARAGWGACADPAWVRRLNGDPATGLAPLRFVAADVDPPAPGARANPTDDPDPARYYYHRVTISPPATGHEVVSTDRYRFCRIRRVEAIGARRAEVVPTPSPNTTIEITNGPAATVIAIQLFPADGGVIAPDGPFNLSAPGSSWVGRYMPPGEPDPFGNPRGGGVEFTTPGSGLVDPYTVATATIGTNGVWGPFDILVLSVDDTEGQRWIPQVIDGVEKLDVAQKSGPPPCDANGVGDANCDGSVNGFDISAFALCVHDTQTYQAAYPNCYVPCACDLNGDGSVNGFDIEGFIARLGG